MNQLCNSGYEILPEYIELMKEGNFFKTKELIISSQKEGDIIRKIIIQKARSITLRQLLLVKNLPTAIVPSHVTVIQYLTLTDSMTTKDVSPSFFQHASHLIVCVYNNPISLVYAVINNFKNPEIQYLIYSSIPALYGFFSSNEHISFAYTFYSLFIKYSTAEQSSVVLRPFYSSVALFRCVEAIMKPFSRKVCLLVDDHSRQIPSLATALRAQIMKKLCLMPYYHLMLFHEMMKTNWTKEQINFMIFHCFLIPQITEYFNSTPYSKLKMPFVQKIISIIYQEELRTNQILDRILSINPVLDVPSCYAELRQAYVLCYPSIGDVIYTTKYICQEKSVDTSLKSYDFGKFTTVDMLKPFWVKVYCRQLPQPLPYRPLVFTPISTEYESDLKLDQIYKTLEKISNGRTVYNVFSNPMTEKEKSIVASIKDDRFADYALKRSLRSLSRETTGFEEYMVIKLQIKRMKVFEQQAIDMELRYFSNYVYQLSEKRGNGLSGYLFSPKSFQNKDLLKLQYIGCFAGQIEILKQKSHFHEIAQMWKDLITPKFEKVDVSSLANKHSTIQFNFWEIVETMQCYDKIAVVRRMNLLNSILDQIWNIEKDTKGFEHYLSLIVTMSIQPDLPGDFLIFNEFFMKQPIFRKMHQDNQVLLWTRFETYLLKVISKESELFSLFLKIRQELECCVLN